MVGISKHQVLRLVQVNPPTMILGFQPGDTTTRICSLSAYIPPNTVAILIGANWVNGSSYLALYPMSAANTFAIRQAYCEQTILPIVNQEIKLGFGASATDRACIYLTGYIVEGVVSE